MDRGKIRISRRRFLQGTAAAAAFTIVPRHVLAQAGTNAPSDKLNIACIGINGMGSGDVHSVAGGNTIVALCDADWKYGAKTFEDFPNAKKYKDFRKMFDEMDKQIDAVTVSTPDHNHAVAAMAAIKRGKHVHCQKPLAHSIYEIRQLMKAAREHKVITQLGNQGHSYDSIRIFCEWIWDGAIGSVKEIHAFCGSNYSRIRQLGQRQEKQTIPDTLDWDQWIGPAAMRPYNSMYLPGSWRGWMPFGSGVIGDWVCHVVDPVFWALDLGAPSTVINEAQGYDPKEHADTFPSGSKVTYEFPAKGNRAAVKMIWFDGTAQPPRPQELEANRKMQGTGAFVYGDKGVISYGSHGAGEVRIIPEAKMKEYKRPEAKIPRVPGGHYQDWLRAIRANKPAGSNFDYGGPLTEIAQLGVIATKMLGQKLQWDGPNMRFTNSEEANKHLNPPYREGWSL
jgi:predicted dehydrogenase